MDAVVKLWRPGPVTPRLTLARRARAPSIVERFSWLPTEASGGLADRNIFVGDPQLKLERAWLVEAGLDARTRLAGRPLRLSPAVFWRRVDDFVQGVPVDATPGIVDTPVEQVAAMNGDATPLRFANVDAEFRGADVSVEWGGATGPALALTASYVHGRRRDIADALYRIAPLNGHARLGWRGRGWDVGLDLAGAGAQRRVSRTNGETPSPGWVTVGLSGGATIGRWRLEAGAENLFDRRYADHLAGVNRVPGGAVAVGERLPGAGRGLCLRLGLGW